MSEMNYHKTTRCCVCGGIAHLNIIHKPDVIEIRGGELKRDEANSVLHYAVCASCVRKQNKEKD